MYFSEMSVQQSPDFSFSHLRLSDGVKMMRGWNSGQLITFVATAVYVNVNMCSEILYKSLSVALSQTVRHHPGDLGLSTRSPLSQVSVLPPEPVHQQLQVLSLRMVSQLLDTAVRKADGGVLPEGDGPVEEAEIVVWFEGVEVSGRLYLPEDVSLCRVPDRRLRGIVEEETDLLLGRSPVRGLSGSDLLANHTASQSLTSWRRLLETQSSRDTLSSSHLLLVNTQSLTGQLYLIAGSLPQQNPKSPEKSSEEVFSCADITFITVGFIPIQNVFQF